MLHNQDISDAGVVKELPSEAQGRDAGPRLDVDKLHRILGHNVKHLEKMNSQSDKEAGGGAVGEDAGRVSKLGADVVLGRREKGGDDFQHAAQGGEGGRPQRLMNATSASDEPDVGGSRVFALPDAQKVEVSFILGDLVDGVEIPSGNQVATVKVGKVAESVIHHHEHLLGVSTRAENKEVIVDMTTTTSNLLTSSSGMATEGELNAASLEFTRVRERSSVQKKVRERLTVRKTMSPTKKSRWSRNRTFSAGKQIKRPMLTPRSAATMEARSFRDSVDIILARCCCRDECRSVLTYMRLL